MDQWAQLSRNLRFAITTPLRGFNSKCLIVQATFAANVFSLSYTLSVFRGRLLSFVATREMLPQ
jgi:hypothetical protein